MALLYPPAWLGQAKSGWPELTGWKLRRTIADRDAQTGHRKTRPRPPLAMPSAATASRLASLLFGLKDIAKDAGQAVQHVGAQRPLPSEELVQRQGQDAGALGDRGQGKGTAVDGAA